MKRLAIVCALAGAMLFGLFDVGISFAKASVELSATESVLMLVYALGRHVVVGSLLALLLFVTVLLSSPRRALDIGVFILAAAISTFYLDAIWDLFEGAKIKRDPNAGLYRAVARYGGPLAILAGIPLLKRILRDTVDPGRRVALGRLFAAAALVLASGLAWWNIIWLPGLYPGVHAIYAFGALAAGTLYWYFALRRRAFSGGLGPRCVGATVLVAALLLASSIVLHRSEGFDRARASAGAFTQGSTPFSRFIGPVYARFAKKREHSVADVSSFMEAARQSGAIDYGAVLDRMLPNRRRMNVLLVAMDTVRWDRTSLSGYRKNPTTPNLERLAAKSYVFERAYTPYPTSNYTYNSILTGICAGASPIHGHRMKLAWEWPEDVYYARLLSKNGWHTNGVFAFEKEHRQNQRYFGYVEKGFDVFNADQKLERKFTGDEVTASVRRQILSRPKSPFFQCAHYMEPHDPYEKWPSFDFGDATSDRYDGEIAYTDSELGKLLEFLDEQGLGDSTIVAVLSDHGEALGDHGLKTHNTSLFESEIRVPFVLHVPSLPGGRVPANVNLVDLMPTVARILGVEDPVRRTGRNLLPLMLEPGKHPAPPVFVEHFEAWSGNDNLEQRCIIHDDFKLIELVESPESSFRLFDLGKDPGERNNLFGSSEVAERQALLLGLLEAALAERNDYHGDIALSDPTAALEDELRKLLETLKGPDAEAARTAATELRNRLRSRYDDLSERCAKVDPALLDAIRAEALGQCEAAFPKIRWELHEILRVLPHVSHAGLFRKMCTSNNPRIKQEGAVALGMLGEEDARPVLDLALQVVKDPITLFPVAMALSRLGDHRLVPSYGPILRGDSTYETAPLLAALAAAKDGSCLRTLYERLALAGSDGALNDAKLKFLALDNAEAVTGAWSDLLLVRLCDETNMKLRESAHAVLLARHGEEKKKLLLERYQLEREALDGQLNGMADLAAERYSTYVERYPDAEARIWLGLARARIGLGDQDGLRQALREMEKRGDAEEKRVAERLLAHAGGLKWFYQPGEGEWRAKIEILEKPAWWVRNRSYFLKVRLTNESKVFWMGGSWIFGSVLRTDITDADGNLFKVDGRDRPITRREILNFLPPEGVAPGESVELVLVGHVPSGQWEDGRLVVGFYQKGNRHIPESGNWLVTIDEPVKPQ